MKPVRWGVIGAGGIALRRTIPEGILPARGARLVAVMDRSPAVRKDLERRFGVPAVATVGELLRQPLDAVYIATPTFQHAEQAIAAARAGVNVLCEKPLARNQREGARIMAACRTAGVKLGVGYMMRFHPAHEQIRRWIAAGAIGKPVCARAQLSCWFPPMAHSWRQERRLGGGGALADLGVHCLDLLEFLLGPIAEVGAFQARAVQRYRDRTVEDAALALLRFRSGALGTVQVQFNLPDDCADNVLEVEGSEGTLKAVGTIGQTATGTVTLRRTQQRPRRYSYASARTNLYRAQIEGFSRAVRRAEAPPVPGEAGWRGLHLLGACDESARRRRFIPVPADAGSIPRPASRATSL